MLYRSSSGILTSSKLHAMKVVDLRNMLGKRKLDTRGVKRELVDRLLEHQDGDASSGGPSSLPGGG